MDLFERSFHWMHYCQGVFDSIAQQSSKNGQYSSTGLASKNGLCSKQGLLGSLIYYWPFYGSLDSQTSLFHYTLTLRNGPVHSTMIDTNFGIRSSIICISCLVFFTNVKNQNLDFHQTFNSWSLKMAAICLFFKTSSAKLCNHIINIIAPAIKHNYRAIKH